MNKDHIGNQARLKKNFGATPHTKAASNFFSQKKTKKHAFLPTLLPSSYSHSLAQPTHRGQHTTTHPRHKPARRPQSQGSHSFTPAPYNGIADCIRNHLMPPSFFLYVFTAFTLLNFHHAVSCCIVCIIRHTTLCY